ncbi:MAG: PAS domain-containing sensor histidine kinase [Myxococcota bacterium]|nr:PAS domain-containing sensor histidine kinase [Myxococcota bacterium]
MSTQEPVRRAKGEATTEHRFGGKLAELYPFTFLTDFDARVCWASEAWASLRTTDPQTALSELCRGLGIPSVLGRLATNGGLLRSRVKVDDGHGEIRLLDLSLFPIAFRDDEPARHVAIARPAATGARSASERLTLIDSAPQALLSVDDQGFVTYANPAAEEFLGFGPDALEGCALAALAVDAEGLEALLHAFESAGRSEFALRLRGGLGETVSAVANSAPHLRSDGRAEGLVIALRRAERSLDSGLGRRVQELEHCVNALAHDLRSPLVALLGFSRLLRQDYGERLDETGAHFLDRIEQAGRTMESLIHDLLELSRIGKPGERPRLVDPRAVLLQLAAELKPRLDAADMLLVLPENPPLVYCDRTRLYQLFSNLIGNALEHMGECEDRRIRVEITEERDHHHLIVRDRGRGVPPKDRQKIFEVFQSLGPRRGKRRGTGMGLAIVRRIAETHQGRAWVDGLPGEGATFHVTLPRH